MPHAIHDTKKMLNIRTPLARFPVRIPSIPTSNKQSPITMVAMVIDNPVVMAETTMGVRDGNFLEVV